MATSKLLAESSFLTGFITFKARLVFAQLRQVFIKVPILYHFDLEYYIGIETDASDYTISEVLSLRTLNYLGQ